MVISRYYLYPMIHGLVKGPFSVCSTSPSSTVGDYIPQYLCQDIYQPLWFSRDNHYLDPLNTTAFLCGVKHNSHWLNYLVGGLEHVFPCFSHILEKMIKNHPNWGWVIYVFHIFHIYFISWTYFFRGVGSTTLTSSVSSVSPQALCAGRSR